MPLSTFLVLGATGGTGRHFTAKTLADGHRVRALVRTPSKLDPHAMLAIRQGSITDPIDVDALVTGVEYIVVMLGDTGMQRHATINTDFMRRLIPAMRRQGVRRILYQAGGLSRPHGGHLTPLLWTIRQVLPSGYKGQHTDNEAVMTYLATEAMDIEWIVHRAGIGSDGTSKGTLERSATRFSVGTHIDCAAYNYRTVMEREAVHTADFSHYAR